MQPPALIDNGPAFIVKQLVCLWLDARDLRAIRCVSKSWCRAASATVLAVAVEGTPGGSQGAQMMQQALAAYQQAIRLRITVHPKLLKSQLNITDGGAVAQAEQRCKPCYLQSSLHEQQDSTSSSDTTSCTAGSTCGCLSNQLTQQLLSKQLLCIDVPDRWKALDRKGTWLQALCELLIEQHRQGTGSPADASAVKSSMGVAQQSNSVPGSSSSSSRVVLGQQFSMCSRKDSGGDSSTSCRDDVVACTGCSGHTDICARPFSMSGQPDRCTGCKSSSFVKCASLCCSIDAPLCQADCCLAHGTAANRQQQQQQQRQCLLLKLPLLPSHSKTPWSLLSQLTNLGSLLLRNACPLSGKQVSALAGCAPQLTCLHAAVTGASAQLQSLSRLTGMQLLHLHGVNVAHRTISSAVLNLHQLRRLQISGDLQLQPLAQLPAACPQLTTLLLQQPLDIPQYFQPRTGQQQQQVQQQAVLAELLAQLPKLQQLSFTSLEPIRVTQPASRSCAGLLWRLQQRMQAAPGEAVLQLTEGVGCTKSRAGQELADALRNPRRYTPESILEAELRRGSLRPRTTAGNAAVCPLSGGQLLLQHTPEAVAGCRVWQLTVRSGSECDLQAELQLCRPAKLHIVTLPALTDVLSCLVWPIDFSAATPLPGKLRVSFPPSSLLCSISIDTSSTQAGLILDDAVLSGISASCPHLCWLKLKGVLCLTHRGGAALHSMHKMLQLTLVDIRHQSIQQLSSLSRAAAAAAEPHMAERLARVAAAKKDVRAIGWLLGCCVCAARLHWHHPRYRAFGGRYVGTASSVLLLAAAPMVVANVVIHSAWGLQQQVASQLRSSAKVLSSVPVIMHCWLPQQLQVLQLKGCCLGRHKDGHCCHIALQQLRGLRHVSVSLQDRSNSGTGVLVTADSSESNKASSSSKCITRCVCNSASASLIAVAEQRQPDVSVACQQLRKAAGPTKQLHKLLVIGQLSALKGQVKALLKSAAAGSGLSFLLKWGGTRAAARLGLI